MKQNLKHTTIFQNICTIFEYYQDLPNNLKPQTLYSSTPNVKRQTLQTTNSSNSSNVKPFKPHTLQTSNPSNHKPFKHQTLQTLQTLQNKRGCPDIQSTLVRIKEITNTDLFYKLGITCFSGNSKTNHIYPCRVIGNYSFII